MAAIDAVKDALWDVAGTLKRILIRLERIDARLDPDNRPCSCGTVLLCGDQVVDTIASGTRRRHGPDNCPEVVT